MKAIIPRSIENLYRDDFVLWTKKIVDLLKEKAFEELDLENLIEEIESMGKSEKQAIESLLIVLFIHLLKLMYWEAERERNLNHWCGEITNFRSLLRRKIAASPSLKSYLPEIYGGCYEDARRSAARTMGMKIDFLSAEPIATIEQTLDDSWFPIPVDGE
jgi:Domain of unknown function DUF29